MRDQPPVMPRARTNAGTAASSTGSSKSLRTALAATPPPLPAEDSAPRQNPWPLTSDPEHGSGSTESIRAQDEARPKAHRRRSSVGPALGYVTLGFIAGAGLWHAVGFWSLVQNAVFSGPRQKIAAPYPSPAERPAVVFDEEELRSFSQRRVAPDRAPISTGSIGDPIPAIATHPQAAPTAAASAEHQQAGPGGISWQPAVKPSP